MKRIEIMDTAAIAAAFVFGVFLTNAILWKIFVLHN